MSVLHTEEVLPSVQRFPDSGDCGLVPGASVSPSVSPSFLLGGGGGVELAWGEPGAFLFLVSSGCKPEHLALGSKQSGLGTCGLLQVHGSGSL